MRAFLIPLILVVFSASIVRYLSTQSSSSGELVEARGQNEVSIVLTDDGFVPRDVQVDRGTTVVFSTTRPFQFWPASNEHPAHTIFPDFDSKRPIDADQPWSYTFERLGEWRFHDHVRSYYSGTIYVVE